MAKLIAQSGHSLDLPQRRTTLGESSSCDIPLAPGLGLAPVHFELVPAENGAWFIRDLSQGGLLLVNGVAIREGILAHGNVIVAGSLQLGFWNAAISVQASASPFLSASVVAPPAPAESPLAAISPIAPPIAAATVQTVQQTVRAEPPPVLFAPESIPPARIPVAPAIPSVLNPSVAGMAPSSAPLAEDLPPISAAAPSKPGLPGLSGPPIAWLDINEEKNAAIKASATTPTQSSEATTDSGQAPPGPVVRSRRWRGFRPGLLSRIPRPAVALLSIGLCGLTGFGLVRIPQVNAALKPLWAKFHAWTNPDLPAKPAAAEVPAGREKSIPVIEDAGITPRAAHNDVVKVFLNERVSNLFQADLKQLIPFYNSNSTARDLPPQKEMTEAFRKHYGVLLDGFDRLSCLRTPGRDEFVFVLSGSSRVDLESMIGLPPQQKPAVAKPGTGKISRVFPVKAGGRVYGIAQYDPFTVVLGNASWIDTSLNGSSGLALREALCMLPESASRAPGALIMVERLPAAKTDNGLVNPFQVAISNLFLKDAGDSRLILTRNPDVKEEVFVEQSSAALKQQASVTFQTLHLSSPKVRAPVSQDVNAVDPDEIITTSEASIKILDGEDLIKEALETVARTFTSQSPSIDLILAAQTAVLRFNQARLQGAAEAASASSVAEAVELLQNGIVIKGKGNVRDLEIRIERMEPEQIELVTHLLYLDSRVGLVYRPDKDALSGSLLDLALKARDFRNAELLISLWAAGNFPQGEAADARSAVRRILDWSNKDGHRKRVSVGLPMLTDLELSGATEMLIFDSGTLKWKPGTDDYRTWLRKVRPDPRTDAKRIAAAFSEAKNAGAIPNGSITQLSEAIHLINKGVRSGEKSLIRAGGYTQDELRAAARYLQWDSGNLKVLDR